MSNHLAFSLPLFCSVSALYGQQTGNSINAVTVEAAPRLLTKSQWLDEQKNTCCEHIQHNLMWRCAASSIDGVGCGL